MSKSFKEKVKDNKSKIITGVIFGVTIFSGSYIINKLKINRGYGLFLFLL